MKIALVQLDIEWEAKEKNYKKAESFIELASKENCDVVVFPEMFNTGFSMNSLKTLEKGSGETDHIISALARKFSIHIICGYTALDEKKRIRNQASVFNSSGELISKYQKIHLFSFASEEKHYIQGDAPVIFDLNGISCSLFICYDLRFPEIFRIISKKVLIIFVIANWPESRIDHWNTLLKARAIENQCFIVGVNRTGIDGNNLSYPGSSKVFDPMGIELAQGSPCDIYFTCLIEPEKANAVRKKFPFLADMQKIILKKKNKNFHVDKIL